MSFGCRPGAFSGVRLLPGAALDAALPTLQLEWASALVDDPPFNLRWMRDHADNQVRARCGTSLALARFDAPASTRASWYAVHRRSDCCGA